MGLLVTHLAAFEILHWYSKKKAAQLLEDDEHLYHSKWSSLMQSASSDGVHGLSDASALSAYITQHFARSVDDLEVRWFRQRPQVVTHSLPPQNMFFGTNFTAAIGTGAFEPGHVV